MVRVAPRIGSDVTFPAPAILTTLVKCIPNSTDYADSGRFGKALFGAREESV
jgi:hypothetical protein